MRKTKEARSWAKNEVLHLILCLGVAAFGILTMSGCAAPRHLNRQAIGKLETETPPTVGPGKIKIGTLGQAIEAADIYAAPSGHAHVYWRVKPYEYLVLSKSPENLWYRIILENGAYGYVARQHIKALPYDVTRDRPFDDRDANSKPTNAATLANQYVGNLAIAGGRDLKKGIGNGEFVQQIKAVYGVHLPGDPAAQERIGSAITRLENLRAGDRLYFWSDAKGRVGSGAIYLGNGYVVLANEDSGRVERTLLNRHWQASLEAARRDP